MKLYLIHPSIIYTTLSLIWGSQGSGASPSWHWAKSYHRATYWVTASLSHSHLWSVKNLHQANRSLQVHGLVDTVYYITPILIDAGLSFCPSAWTATPPQLLDHLSRHCEHDVQIDKTTTHWTRLHNQHPWHLQARGVHSSPAPQALINSPRESACRPSTWLWLTLSCCVHLKCLLLLNVWIFLWMLITSIIVGLLGDLPKQLPPLAWT